MAQSTPDVLFILEGLSQTVGGVHVVIELCNALIERGIKAQCAIVGKMKPEARAAYQEQIAFELLHFPSEAAFIADGKVRPKLIVATLFTTTLPAFVKARKLGVPVINFIQGYEAFFANGIRAGEVLDSYVLADQAIVTSKWLEENFKRCAPGRPAVRLPLGVDKTVFNAGPEREAAAKVRLAAVIRSAPDKGQWVLMDALNQLAAWKDRIALTVFLAGAFKAPRAWGADAEIVRMPLAKSAVAEHFRACDILLDASFHEGFGMMPLEAMACGATAVVSDSGGPREYIRNNENGIMIAAVNKPEAYVAAVRSLVDDPSRLARMKASALETARRRSAKAAWDTYADRFANWLQQPPPLQPDNVIESLSGESELRWREVVAAAAATAANLPAVPPTPRSPATESERVAELEDQLEARDEELKKAQKRLDEYHTALTETQARLARVEGSLPVRVLRKLASPFKKNKA